MTGFNHVCSPDPNREAAKLAVAASLGILANSGGVATFPQKTERSIRRVKISREPTAFTCVSQMELVKAIFPVSNQNDKQEIEELLQLNQELTASLRRCRSIIKDCRDHLAANSNEADWAEETDGASRSS
jgi:hypothetical protein